MTNEEPQCARPGQSIGPYLVEARVGRGGMGEVYRARDTKLPRTVALKLLPVRLSDETARRRFQREAEMASSLNHPHILTIHDLGIFEGRQYLVTESVATAVRVGCRAAAETAHSSHRYPLTNSPDHRSAEAVPWE